MKKKSERERERESKDCKTEYTNVFIVQSNTVTAPFKTQFLTCLT